MNNYVPFKTVDGKKTVDMDLWDILIEYGAEQPKEKKIDIPFKNVDGKPVVDMDYWDLLLDLQDEPEFLYDKWEPTFNDYTEEKPIITTKVPEDTVKPETLIVNLEPEKTKTEKQEEEIYQELMSVFVKPKPQTPSLASVVRRKVYAIWRDCIVTNPHDWDNPDYVMGKGINNEFAFQPDKIIEYSDEIIMLLRLVDNATTIEELKVFNSGEEWTKLIQPVEFLMSLGDALYQMKYDKQIVMEKGTARARVK